MGILLKTFFLFTDNLGKGNKKVKNLLLEICEFCSHEFPSLVWFVLYY